MNFKKMIQIGNKIYLLEVTGDWLLCGEIVDGVDCDYIHWFE